MMENDTHLILQFKMQALNINLILVIRSHTSIALKAQHQSNN